MKDKLLLKLHKDIIERLKEIGCEDYSHDLSDLNDPIINAILDLRRNIFINKYDIY